MTSEDENKYKQIEIKYKKVEAMAKVIAAIAAIASATAAFLALRSYTNNPVFTPGSSSPNQAIPATPSKAKPVVPTTPPQSKPVLSPKTLFNQQATPHTQPLIKQESLRSPVTQPKVPSSKVQDDDADDNIQDDDNDDDDLVVPTTPPQSKPVISPKTLFNQQATPHTQPLIKQESLRSPMTQPKVPSSNVQDDDADDNTQDDV